MAVCCSTFAGRNQKHCIMALQSIYQPELPFCEFAATDLCVSRHVSQQLSQNVSQQLSQHVSQHLIHPSSTSHPAQNCEKICANENFSVPLQRERKYDNMKRFLFTLGLIVSAITVSAKIWFIPNHYTRVMFEDSLAVYTDSTIHNELSVSPTDERFTVTIVHDTLTKERVKAIKWAKTSYALSITAGVIGAATSILSAVQTPLTPLDAKFQSMSYTNGLSTVASSTFMAYLSKSIADSLQKLPISVIINNNTSQEMCVNDMVRGLIWYMPPYGSIVLSVGNPEVNRFRIAYADGSNPKACYMMIEGANYLEKVKLKYEDDDYWIYKYEDSDRDFDLPTLYIIREKLTQKTHTLPDTRFSRFIEGRPNGKVY